MKTTIIAMALSVSTLSRMQAQPAALPEPVCITNFVCDLATHGNPTVTFGVSGVTVGMTNHLYRANQPAGVLSCAAWEWVRLITNCDPVTLTNQPKVRAFYVVGPEKDTDGDGIPDWWEATHGLNPNDPRDANLDPDDDGETNLQEYQHGTDPNDPGSFQQVQLGHWRFDDTNTWVGEQGQLPIQTMNVTGVASWISNALQVDSTNAPALLGYQEMETNGSLNINLRRGAIRFWFKPDWDSGTGPLGEGRLVEAGDCADNEGWALLFDINGTQIRLLTRGDGVTMTNVAAPIEWHSNEWHQVVLVYSKNDTSLGLDGLLVANGCGVTHWPGASVRAQGFRIGSDRHGNQQARGQFDELETFNYPLNAADIRGDYMAVINRDSNGDGMSDYFEWLQGLSGGVPDTNGVVRLLVYTPLK